MPHQNTMQPFEPVSFVIPARNESNYLPATIESIHRAIEPISIGYEIIVVNDASTDNTRALAIRGGAKTLDVQLRNIGAVRNAGAQAAKNGWLIFLDADTILPQQTLQETLESLARGDVGGGAFVQISREKRIPAIKYLMYLGVVLGWQTIGRWAAGCYMFCLKSQFDEFGGFNENYYAAEELFFSRELKTRGKFTLVKTPVITSARKLHAYSTFQLIRFIFRPLVAGKLRLQSKTGLEILYNDKR